MPVGVISSSASTTPENPSATPSRIPANIIGLAAGRITLTICWRREPMNERHMSTSDGETLRTALKLFIAITGSASMMTASTLEVSPMP